MKKKQVTTDPLLTPVPMREDVDALGVTFRRPRVFIVDDEEAVTDLLSSYLEGEGYEVRSFTDPIQAFGQIAKARPDVVLADLQMPTMPGLEMMTRAAAVSPETVFIIITAFTTIDTLMNAIRFCVHDYLTKPFASPETVRLVVRNAQKKKALETLSRMQATVTGTILKLGEIPCLGESRDAFFGLAGRVFSKILGADAVACMFRSEGRNVCRISSDLPLAESPAGLMLKAAARGMPDPAPWLKSTVSQEYENKDITSPMVQKVESLLSLPVMGLDGVEAHYVAAHSEPSAFTRDSVKMALSFARSVTIIVQRHFMGASHEHQMIIDLLHHLREGVVVIDREYIVRFANPQGRKILGVAQDADPGECIAALDAVDPALVDRQDPRSFTRSLQKQVSVTVDGIDLSFDVQVYSIQTPTKVAYRVIIFRDITHLKRERSRIEGLNMQLRQLNKELTERAARLEAMNKELDSFAYIASHDLQEPFRHIEIFVQFLERDLGLSQKLPNDIEYLLQQIVKNVDVAKRILADLRTLSRVTRMRNPYRNIGLVDLVEDVLQRFSDTLPQRNGRVVVKDLPEVVCDGIKMKEVLHNLISNALKYNDSTQPTVTISAESNGDVHTVCVEDNGIGIDKEYHEYIFQACRRIPGKMDVQGSGLGLAIAKKVVEEHGGRIWVESALGSGAKFYFTIPKGLG